MRFVAPEWICVDLDALAARGQHAQRRPQQILILGDVVGVAIDRVPVARRIVDVRHDIEIAVAREVEQLAEIHPKRRAPVAELGEEVA